MKLLGWMHRKFRQNNSEPLKDFASGQSPFDYDNQFYQKPHHGFRPLRQSQRDNQLRNSFTGTEASRMEDYDFEDESSAALSELFHGFLAIGTLGSDAVANDPSTPTFGFSVENITEKETEVTENELKLINDELEKVLRAEAKEESYNNDSSGRSSYVSTGRSSHGSTITLSGKTLEGVDSNGNGTNVCPLQGYLFGSSIELPETTVAAKKEHRTSLGELFQRTKMAEEGSGTKRGEDKSAVHLMKKILKKKILHPISKTPAATTTCGTADSVSAETKLHKILNMFQRKVHPESSTDEQKSEKPLRNKVKNNSYDGGYVNEDPLGQDDDIMIFPQRHDSRRSIRRYKSQSNPSHFAISSTDSNGKTEYWIKTDAEYLVLEL